jgi:UDP-2-acetamido-3-amino-2,3-dideoxy-glucuronate N-acetyltransferase
MSTTANSDVSAQQPIDYFCHPRAVVETTRIGARTRIWAFAHILPKAVIGADCNICDGVFIENDVWVGDRVTIKCGVQLWDGVTLDDDVFVGPNATFTNDAAPRGHRQSADMPRTLVNKGATIGANSTILPGISIGSGAMVGAGAVVTRNVPPNAIVVGNPAYISGYADAVQLPAFTAEPQAAPSELRALRVANARLVTLPMVEDLRGALTFGEYSTHVPFVPVRYFVVFNVPNKEVRGEHAHKELHEFLVCLRGSCAIALDDGRQRDEVLLDSPTIGVYVPPGIWRVHYKYSSDAALLVLASDTYKADDYIRDYDEFQRSVAKQRA